jgi:hypothetical protein
MTLCGKRIVKEVPVDSGYAWPCGFTARMPFDHHHRMSSCHHMSGQYVEGRAYDVVQRYESG